MKRKMKFCAVVLFALLMASCSAPKLGYFQDVQSGAVEQLQQPQLMRAQQGDKLSIIVSSKNPELAYLFNLPVVGRYRPTTSNTNLQTSTVTHYTVDELGNIDFPVLGPLHIAGLTRSEIQNLVKNKLLTSDMIKDPIVTVDFLDMYYEVMGEVNRPGRFLIDHDKVTLLDALSQAGDLTINGKREILLLREENGKQRAFRVNLQNHKELYSSPAFYLKQNDVLYVEPNDKKARESTSIGNDLLRPSMWISIASFATSLILLIKNWK